ncbi:MAG: gamma-glutamyltransferase [Gammaproteobacteria bacterium]|nr:gamma-glutamyltransferase [Gammaproteobacteria bacterium]MCY4356048.1 gamma-glutamyltransferase [Gammaproteobacteria bacterium]
MPKRLFVLLITNFLVLVPLASSLAQNNSSQPLFEYSAINHPVMGNRGMVASHNVLSTQIAVDILARGGNAIDAGAALGFALAVTLPRAGNIGGGGFMLVHVADQNKTIAIDFRETAPASATSDMFFDEMGKVVADEIYRFSHRSSAVPGSVAGLSHIVEHYGTMSLAEVLEPAIRLARDGIEVTHDLAQDLARSQRLKNNPAALRKFYKPDGSNYEAGEIFKQPDLAWTLSEIAEHGADAFYRGSVAEKIVADMEVHDGLITMEDLASYTVVEREPVRGTFREFDIAAMPAPSSGGTHVIQMLNILENFSLAEMGPESADALHIMAEAMKFSYADRSRYLGDPDFVEVPTQTLVSKEYAKDIAARISPDRALSFNEVAPGDLTIYESDETTHYSVVDSEGNMVGNTYTLMFSFGSGVVIEGTGILMNNNMGNFTLGADIPDAFGLMGSENNLIRSARRPVSSMSPVLVSQNGQPLLMTGSPGGSKIISANMQMLLNVLEFGMNIADAAVAPRVHHQWRPDVLEIESGISPDTVQLLIDKGHNINFSQRSAGMGSLQTVMWQNGKFYGYSDPRRPGAGAVGLD